jgi:hypothetical protein
LVIGLLVCLACSVCLAGCRTTRDDTSATEPRDVHVDGSELGPEWTSTGVSEIEPSAFEFECVTIPEGPVEATTTEFENSAAELGISQLVGEFASVDAATAWIALVAPPAFQCLAPDSSIAELDDIPPGGADQAAGVLFTYPNSEFAQLFVAHRYGPSVTITGISAPTRADALGTLATALTPD